MVNCNDVYTIVDYTSEKVPKFPEITEQSQLLLTNYVYIPEIEDTGADKGPSLICMAEIIIKDREYKVLVNFMMPINDDAIEVSILRFGGLYEVKQFNMVRQRIVQYLVDGGFNTGTEYYKWVLLNQPKETK